MSHNINDPIIDNYHNMHKRVHMSDLEIINFYLFRVYTRMPHASLF